MNTQRKKKEETVLQIKDKFANSQGTVLADYRGLNVTQLTELRAKLREQDVEFKVLKNTLVQRAAQEIGLEGLDDYLKGPTAIAFGLSDPVTPAKLLNGYAKDHKVLEIKAGVLQGKVISMEQVKALAELPSREELLAKVLGGMQGPLYGLVNVLQGNLRNLVYVLDAVRKQKEAEA